MIKKSLKSKPLSSKSKRVKLSEDERVIAENARAEIHKNMIILGRLIFKSLGHKSSKLGGMKLGGMTIQMPANKPLDLKAGKVKLPPIKAWNCAWNGDCSECGCEGGGVCRPCTLQEAQQAKCGG